MLVMANFKLQELVIFKTLAHPSLALKMKSLALCVTQWNNKYVSLIVSNCVISVDLHGKRI